MHQQMSTQRVRMPRVVSLCVNARRATALAAIAWCATAAGKHVPLLAVARWPLLCLAAGLLLMRMPRSVIMHSERAMFGAVTASVALAALSGGAWSWHTRAPVDAGSCEGWAQVRADPTWRNGRLATIVEINSRRMRVDAYGSVASRLALRSSGEHVFVVGECSPLAEPVSSYDAVAHVVGRMRVDDVAEHFGTGSPAVRASNRVRGIVADGVASMPTEMQSLFLGLVMGDDRAQPREMIENFRAAGMSHLTAVSGQNVAYLLAMMSPLLAYLTRTRRLLATLGIIAWFVMLTRGEPSVLRAAVMASLVALGGFLSWGLNARVVLAATTVVLLMVDPMLARSVGFALSVGATAGLAWYSATTSDILGARGLRGIVASTVAAQAGTMLVSTVIFGVPPVVSLVANPLSIPVAGVVMTIGLPLSMVSALVEPVAPIVTLVLTPLVWWVATVARLASAFDVPTWVDVCGWSVVAWWMFAKRPDSSRNDLVRRKANRHTPM